MGGDAGSAPTGGNTWETFTTKFNQHDLDGLKSMLDGASVQQVRDVAQHWQDLHDQLVGPGDGGGGIQKRFEDAVKKVLESWHGDTAEKFAKRAQDISQNFSAGAPYAAHTAQVMGQTANDLQKAIDKVKPIDDGWNWSDDVWGEMPWSDQIDDDDLNDALKTGVSTQGILDANKDNLSGHQKKRLEAAVAMENLGTAYVVRASSLKPPAPGGGRVEDRIPDHQDPTNGLGAMPMPMPGMGGPGGGGGGGGMKIPTRGIKAGSTPKMPTSPSINTPHTPGVSGGVGSMKPKIPNVNTGLDGLGGGGGGTGVKLPGGGGAGGLNGGAGGGVHMPGGGGGGAGVNIPGGGGLGMAGTGGMSGRGAGGVKGGAGGLKGGTAGAGGAAGARAGRAGMPGMGGAHGGAAGKGMGGKPGVSTGGAMARQKGGIVGGAAGGKSSAGGQGGSGLHRSRGGTAAGTNSGSGRRPAGMMGGAHGAHGGKGEGKGNDSSRPDYLVEDEETWTTERNVAPRVIE